MTEKDFEILEAQVASSELRYVTAKEGIIDSLGRYLSISKKQDGLQTGFKYFDQITGGFKKNHFIVLAAESNGGKTTWALNLINNVLQSGVGVLIYSLEMDSDEILDGLVCMNSSVYRSKFNTGKFNQYDWTAVKGTSELITSFPLYIFDDPDMSMEEIRKSALIMTAQHSIGLIVIDYLQLVNTGSFRDSREQQVASISRACKKLVKECKIPILGLSQLNEKKELRESRAILHDANTVLMLSGNAPKINLTVTKGRSIPKGSYTYLFEPDIAKFTETDCDAKLHALMKDMAC